MTESETERERIPYGEPQTWYFTFGFGTAFAQRYYKVENETFDAARDQMFQIFGREWAFQYDEVDWYRDGVSQAEQYGLAEIVWPSLRLLPTKIREEVNREIVSMGRAAKLVGHASVGGVSLVVLDLEPLPPTGGRTTQIEERRWLLIVEEPQHSGNRTQTASGIARTLRVPAAEETPRKG